MTKCQAADKILKRRKVGSTMSKFDRVVRGCSVLVLVAPMLASAGGEGKAQPAAAGTAPVVSYAEQGWSQADRDIFYTTGQGSLMMPYAWFKALRRLDIDAPFAADDLFFFFKQKTAYEMAT